MYLNGQYISTLFHNFWFAKKTKIFFFKIPRIIYGEWNISYHDLNTE